MSEENKTEVPEVRDPAGLLSAYEKAKADLVELRNNLKSAEQELETLKASTSDDEVAKWRNRAIKAAVKAAVEQEGIKGGDRLMKYLNLDGIDFDENEKLTGLDEKLGEVKKDFPELFDVKRRAGSSSVDIHANKPPVKPVSGTEAQVARIFSKS